MSNEYDYEPVPLSELTPASEVENSDKLLVQGADGILKTATRAQVNAYVQTEIDTEEQVRASEDTNIRQTFTRFQVVPSVPNLEDMLPRVLYLYNATGDVYQGYYLIEGVSASQNSRGQIGGRSYTGINGITVDFENATISNDLVTDGGTIGDDLIVNGEVTINDDATITGKVEVGNGLDVTGDLSATGDATVGGDAGITGGLSVGGATTIGGNTQVNGNLDITGNITQHGSAYETHAEKLYTKKDMIYLRDGAVSPLGSDEVTGLCAKNYDLEGNDGVLVFNRDGTARVGDKGTRTVTVYSSDGTTFYTDSEMTEPATIPSGVTPTATGETNEYSYTENYDDTEPLLTRSETSDLQNNDLLRWNSTTQKAEKVTRPQTNNTYLKAVIQNGQISYDWGAGGGKGVAFKGTRAQYEVAKLIDVGQDGHIPSGALVIITDEGRTYVTNGTGSSQTLELVANATFNGSHAEWNALTPAQKAMYNIVNFNDDEAIGLTISDTVEDGNMNPVTSNGVFDYISSLSGVTQVGDWKLIRLGSSNIYLGLYYHNNITPNIRAYYVPLPAGYSCVQHYFGQCFQEGYTENVTGATHTGGGPWAMTIYFSGSSTGQVYEVRACCIFQKNS